MTEPLVSVVIPCFNQGRYLPTAVQSLQKQTLADWECVLVDDGSTDETPAIAKSLVSSDLRVRYLRQENAGPSAARNSGVKMTRGQFVQFLDADDLIEPDKLKIHVEHLRLGSGVGIVYGDVRYFADGNDNERKFGIWGEERPWVDELARSIEPMLTKLLVRNVMTMNCPVLRRSVLEEVGSFNERVMGCEDWDYWVRCAALGVRFHYCPRPGTLALVRGHPWSTSLDSRRMIEGECRFRVELGRLLRGRADLRVQNFETAVRRLGQLCPADYTRRVLELGRANLTGRVGVYAILRILDRRDRIRAFVRLLRSSIYKRIFQEPPANGYA